MYQTLIRRGRCVCNTKIHLVLCITKTKPKQSLIVLVPTQFSTPKGNHFQFFSRSSLPKAFGVKLSIFR